MRLIVNTAQRLLVQVEPEFAHKLAILAISNGIALQPKVTIEAILSVECFGLTFPNPLGVAAGFDKNAQAFDGLLDAGFGFTEVGTVTPLAQPGNPAPRVFRLRDQRAVINRLGFNNDGHEAVFARISATFDRFGSGILGVNVGANKDADDRIADYALGIQRFAPLASYLTINISSPNTPGLRDLQMGEDLDRLLSECVSARNETDEQTPLLLKIAPDLDDEALSYVVEQTLAHGIDGMIISNTTLSRDGVEGSRHASEAGGLSGPPLFERSTIMLAKVYEMTEGKLPLVGAGGISNAQDALTKVKAGATLLQMYTGLIYGGISLLSDIQSGMADYLRREGAASLSDIRGSEAAAWARR